MKNFYFVCLAAIITCFSGCATIVHGPYQRFVITADPKKAAVFIDGKRFGTTPTMVRLTRRKNHRIELQLEGYQPYKVEIKRRLDGWVFGNIALGGVVGLGIDALTGSIYRLTPKDIYPTLEKEGLVSADRMAIVVTMTPAKDREKLGQFSK